MSADANTSDVLDIESEIRIMLETLYGAYIRSDALAGRYIEVRHGRLPSVNLTESIPASDNVESIVRTLQKIYKWCESKEENVYVGRSLRDRTGYGSKECIGMVGAVSFDIDPLRPKDAPSSDEEISKAVDIARRISGQLHCRATILSSGNGAQLWVPLDRVCDVRFRETMWEDCTQRWSESILHECGLKYGDNLGAGCRIDSQSDIARIVKALGSKSFKGICTTDRPHRRAFWNSSTNAGRGDGGVYLSAESIWSYGVGSTTSARGLAEVLPTPPSKFWGLLSSDYKLKLSWLGLRDDLDDKTGSGQDCALVQRLKYYRFTPEECVAVLAKSPGGKKRGNPQYWEHTVRKVFGL